MNGPDLRKLRLDNSLTAAAIGAHMGISEAGVFNIETRRRPHKSTVARYAAAVDQAVQQRVADLVSARSDRYVEAREQLAEATEMLEATVP